MTFPLTGPTAPIPSSPQRTDLRTAAQGFEAIFVRRMLEAARAADFGGTDVIGGSALDQYTAMRDEYLAQIAAERGTFGIARSIEAQVVRQQGDTALGTER